MVSLKATHFFLAFNPPNLLTPALHFTNPCPLHLIESSASTEVLLLQLLHLADDHRVCACASREVILTPHVKGTLKLGPDRPYLGRQPFPLPALLGRGWCRHHRPSHPEAYFPPRPASFPQRPELLLTGFCRAPVESRFTHDLYL